MSVTTDILTVDRLRAYYQMNYFGIEREVRAVEDVTMRVKANEVYGIAGESSSGKTSLIKVLAAAIRPPLRVLEGSVTYRFNGNPLDITRAAEEEIEAVRWRHLSYIMQGSMSVLNPVRRIGRIFEDFAFRPMGLKRDAFRAAVEAHLARLHLEPGVMNSYPHELSGGMRQRVTIALATVCRPEFIIADEPTTALDVVVQKDVLAMIREVQQALGSSVVFVTHDMAVHASIADRLAIVYAGRIVEEAPTRTIFTAARHPYTRHLVASLPRIGDTSPKPSLEGRPPSLAEPPPGCRFHPRCPIAIERCRKEVPILEEWPGEHRVACFRAHEAIPAGEILHLKRGSLQ
ncbi:ABC transporter ATP-binding protein [Chelativorans sp.]|uniref:ABC transporter ATP-binding protein n=1 Tax=Chelativorans sp. TaxID=2203393 RepID=UPI0028115DD1|nr:ABC transporter ATP-binding protein [Chelativorans sp.]